MRSWGGKVLVSRAPIVASETCRSAADPTADGHLCADPAKTGCRSLARRHARRRARRAGRRSTAGTGAQL